MNRLFRNALVVAGLLGLAAGAEAARLMENLGRGVVAVRRSSAEVFVSWRLLGVDPPNLAFNVYRATGGGAPVLLNGTPLTGGTHFVDAAADLTQANAYSVRPVLNGVELAASAPFTLAANAPVRQFLSVPLQPTSPATYVHLAWVGDLTGDGELDYVVDRLPLAGGATIKVDAYRHDGAFLWRVDLGPNSLNADNISGGSSVISNGHNDGLTVYDLDSDGRAEVLVRTANGVVFADGSVLSAPDDLTQFVSVIDGATGAERTRVTIPNDYPAAGPYGGHFGIAYLDGVRPSLLFKAKNRNANGSFNLSVTTYDYRDGTLSLRWKWLRNQNAADFHQIRIVDVDGDGRDELCDGGYVLNSDGTFRYALSGVIHGDRFHIGDLDPDRPGLEGFGIQQDNGSGLLYYYYDAATGQILRNHFGGVEDTARGTAADIDPRHRGYEYWSFHGVHTAQTGQLLSPEPLRPWPNFRIWWDGDTLSETLNRTFVEKWGYATATNARIFDAGPLGAIHSWRDAPPLYGDLFGDWREEVLFENAAHTELMIATTTIPTEVRLYTLLHNPEYRLSLTVKGYMQSHMLDYYLGDGMTAPPAPDIAIVQPAGSTVPVVTSFADDTGRSAQDRVTRDATPTLFGTAPAGRTVVVSRLDAGDDGSATADGDGGWTFAYTAPLPDGEHGFVTRSLDGAGQPSADSWPVLIEIDTVPPAAPVIAAVTLADAFAVSGTAEAGLDIEAAIDGVGPIGTTVAAADGSWAVPYTGGPLPAGAYTFRATATDRAGNSSLSTPVVVDSTLAVPTLTAILDDTGPSSADHVTADNRLVLEGTTRPDGTVSVVLFGQGALGSATADAEGRWVFDYTGTALADGVYAFTASATEGAGSPGAPPLVARIDTAAPAVTLVTRQNPTAAVTSAARVTFRVTFSEEVVGLVPAVFTPVVAGGVSGTVESVSATAGGVVDVVVALSGEGDVRLDVAAGAGITDLAGNALAGAFSAGQTYTRLLEGNGVWTRLESGGLWNDGGNWSGGVVANGPGTNADFTGVEVTDEMVVHLDTPRTVATMSFGDTDPTSVGSWLVDDAGDAANTLTLGGASPVVTVAGLGTGATATLGVTLQGTLGLAKAGTGTLVLTRPNAVTGNLNVNQGTLRLVDGGTLTVGAASLGAGGARLEVNGGTLTTTGTATVNPGGGTGIFINGGTASFGTLATSNSSGGIIRIGGGTVTVGNVNFPRSTDGTIRYDTGFIIAGGQTTAGTINLGTNNSNGVMSIEGGSLSATGAVTLGNQSSGGRGGVMRVIGGTFTSSNVADGVIVVRRNNNASHAHFLGGVSTVEKFTLGFDATVVAGTGNVNLNGGTLYVGGGGFVKNAGGTFAANLNFTGGLLGAKADWATTLPVQIPAGGALVIQAADAAGAPHTITLTGVVSGPGGFNKTGGGPLVLEAANTFAGGVTVSAGVLDVAGSVGAGAPLQVAAGGTLTGGGTVLRAATVRGGIVAPGEGPGTTLTVESMTWEAGQLRTDLSAGRALAVLGAFTGGTGGSIHAALSASTPLTVGTVYPLATFASTDLVPAQLSFSGLHGYTGLFVLGGQSLGFLVTGAGPTAEFTHWGHLQNLPEGQRGAGDDPDDDGIANLLEFAQASDPLVPNPDGLIATTVEVEGVAYPAVRFRRRSTLGGVGVAVNAASDLLFAQPLSTVEEAAIPVDATTDDVLVRSVVPTTQEAHQFFKLTATLPAE